MHTTSSSSRSHVQAMEVGPCLPTELWTRIFRFATLTHATEKLFETKYVPFHDPPEETERAALREAGQTALALTRVSRLWREISLEFVYESIRLNHDTSRLLQGLKSSAQRGPEEGYGRWVKRLELSMVEHEDSLNPVEPHNILAFCPNVNVLVKYDDDLLPHSIDSTDLAGIKRFDWWSARYRDGNHRFQTRGDDKSRGLDLLREVISRSPNLEYLLMAKRYSTFTNILNTPQSLLLPSLATLRIESIDAQLRSEMETWSFPKLTTIVMDSSLLWFTCSPILRNPSIEVIELIDDAEFFEMGYLVDLFSACSHIKELGYRIEYIRPSRCYPSSYPSLRRIRLHSKANPTLQHVYWPAGLKATWKHIEDHFSMFTRSTFPSLDQIILHGDWSHILNQPQFASIHDNLKKQNIQLDLDRSEVWTTKRPSKSISIGSLFMEDKEAFSKSTMLEERVDD